MLYQAAPNVMTTNFEETRARAEKPDVGISIVPFMRLSFTGERKTKEK